ncbi:hypothetical protein [Streptomyces venezuelae]|uniref:hypothetical protein n=1 Tax=Streptomyces venezuelae TaxID=54571 RepID=UPI00379D529A
MKSTVQTVKNYENGRAEPKSLRLEAYWRLRRGWAAKYPPQAAFPPCPLRSWPLPRDRRCPRCSPARPPRRSRRALSGH